MAVPSLPVSHASAGASSVSDDGGDSTRTVTAKHSIPVDVV